MGRIGAQLRLGLSQLLLSLLENTFEVFEFGLEFANACGQRGLRDVARLRCPAEMTLPRQCVEVLELAQQHSP